MKKTYKTDPEILERIIIKSLFIDEKYAVIVSSVFEEDYFTKPETSKIFGCVKDYFTKYNKIPDRQIIYSIVDDKEKIEEEFKEIDAIDFNLTKNYDFLLDETNSYLKEQAIKKAILRSVDVIDKKEDISLIREEIENAICKDINIDLGLCYFRDISKRLKEIFSASEIRVPTYFPQFDEYISGGFPPFTLSVIVARIHGMKSNTLANFASRQVINGHNVGLISLEMSEMAFSQRFDSIFSLLDINRMYSSSNRKKLIEKLKKLKENEKRGELFIKQFPTGDASVDDIKRYMRELLIRKTPLDILYVDYINLMKPSSGRDDGLYMKVKRIAEQLRALSFEFKIPIVSVSQLNREGSFVGFEDVDFNYIGECLDPNTLVNHKKYGKIKMMDLKINDEIEGKNGYVNVKNISKKKKRKFIIKTKSGKEIICSEEHKFPTKNGLKSIKNGLKKGDILYKKDIITKMYQFYKGKYMIIEDEIIEIIETNEYIDMIDIEVSDDNLFFANDILTHNSLGIPATADFMAIYGTDDNKMVYENELLYKIVKNRLGGQVGKIDSIYYDSRTLKMYDVTEEELWMKDAETTSDSREPYTRRSQPEGNSRRR